MMNRKQGKLIKGVEIDPKKSAAFFPEYIDDLAGSAAIDALKAFGKNADDK